MGVFEMAPFEGGTKSMMDKIVEVTTKGTITVIGDGHMCTDECMQRTCGFSNPQDEHKWRVG